MHALLIFKLPKHPSSRWHDDDDDDDDDDNVDVKMGGRGCTPGHKNSCQASSFLDASYAAGFPSILFILFRTKQTTLHAIRWRLEEREKKSTEEVLTDDLKIAWAILAKVTRT